LLTFKNYYDAVLSFDHSTMSSRAGRTQSTTRSHQTALTAAHSRSVKGHNR